MAQAALRGEGSDEKSEVAAASSVYQWTTRHSKTHGCEVAVVEFNPFFEDHMSKLSAVIAGISLASFASNPVQTVETAILNLIKSTDTNYAALEPELDGAVNGIVPLITKILKVYAFAKVEASLKEFLVYLGGKYPNIAPELNIIISKL